MKKRKIKTTPKVKRSFKNKANRIHKANTRARAPRGGIRL